MKRLLLAVVCLAVGGVIGTVRVVNAVLDRLDEADRDGQGQVVPIRIPRQRVPDGGDTMSPHPSIGRVVIYRSKTGTYSMPAIISATVDTLYRPNVDAGHVPDLSSDEHVHLTVFTPGRPGERSAGTAPDLGRANPPAGGTLQEWDIPQYEPALDQAGDAFATGDYTAQPPGTWAWPPRVG